jgi:phenylalanyl-tRNA synthetase beta chain
MKVTYNWLKDFVEIKLAPKVLAEKLTMSGLEVTSLEQKEGDFVFEIEVTSNRADCLSVIGIAREVAAITDSKYRAYSVERRAYSQNLNAIRYPLSAKSSQQLSLRIENKKDCPLYTAKIIREVKVGPSPEWLRKRLELIGCRSVNNIVDITNYILFTWGEPLHAFDLDKLKGDSITVRRAKNAEEIITIDAQPRKLSPEILVIADERKPVALAGIMGGKDTEVTAATKNILLEAAIFNPIIIRRGRQKLGVQSDSSYRFERGIDSQIVEKASSQAVGLIQELTGGVCVLAKSSGQPKIKRKSINLEVARVNKILGTNIASSKIKKILNSLEFKTKTKAKNSFRVEIPSHRPDIDLEIDLIEEIARISSYEFIPKTIPAVRPQVTADEPRTLVSGIKNMLIGLGLQEVITYGLTDKDLLRSFGERQTDEVIEILNPLSKEQEVLRPQLIPSLVRCVADNLNQKQEYVNIFEMAKVFSQAKAAPQEELHLGIALCGAKSLLLAQGLIKDAAGLLHLKGIFEVLFTRLGVRDYNFKATDNPSRIDVCAGKEKIGFLAKLDKEILDSLDIKNKEVFVAELYLERLLPYAELNKKFVHLPLYPGISRDISLILKEEIPVGDILEAIQEKGRPLLKEAKVVDYYKGKQIPSGFKGLTLSCLYRREERTLIEAEINPVHSLVCTLLKERFGAQIR